MKQIIIAFIFMLLLIFLGFVIGLVFSIIGNLIKNGNLNYFLYKPIIYSWTIVGFFVGAKLFIEEVIYFIRIK